MRKLSPDITDEELNDLFREAAGSWQVTVHSGQKDEGWEKMKSDLSSIHISNGSHPPNDDRFRRSSKLMMVLLLWAMMFTCWMMQPPVKKTSHENKLSGSTNTIKSSGTVQAETQIPGTDPYSAAKKGFNQLPASTVHQEIPQQDSHSPAVSHAMKSKETGTGKPSRFDRSDVKSEQKDFGFDRNQAEQMDTGANSALTDEPHGGHNPVNHEGQHDGLFNESVDSISDAANAVMTPGRPEQITGDNTVASKTKAEKKDKKNKSKYARWAVGLTVGADWSMVGSKSQATPGFDKGVLITYRISKKWSLESGLLMESKIYSARPGDYHSVNSYPNVTGIDASCRVFDLPINIRYNIWQPHKKQVFVAAGLSSFWMQKESYRFRYDANGALSSSELNIYHQNRHFLSIANIAVGYEHTWGKVSAQVSPYLKIPLGGIGYGHVKLFSTGIMGSVKYNF